MALRRLQRRSPWGWSCAPKVRASKGDAMRYQVTTPLTPREALEQALADLVLAG